MANVQLVRTRQTYATTTINEVQSIQLVQTMLHGALSTLTYLRELFPEKAFEDRYYEMRETPLPYADFAAARMPSLKAQADEHSTKLPILLRQRSKRADLFLDWLENGVFPELDSGDLRAVQLLIHPDKRSRDAVLETYTFTVHYTVNEDGRRTPSGLAASSSGNTAATAKATNTALQQLLRSVGSLCQDLPVLPEGRLMSMALIYEDTKGKDKSVKGFVPCRGDELSFAKAKGWHNRTKSLEFTTGHHDTLLKITGLHVDQSPRKGQTQELPSNISFSSDVSRYNDVLLMPPPAIPHHSGPSRRGATSARDLEELKRKQTAVTEYTDRQNAAQRSNMIKNMNSDLQEMMQPEQITQGDTQTQGAFQYSAFEDAVTVTPTTIRAPSVQSSRLQTPVTTDTFPLLADTQHSIAARKLYLSQTASALARKVGGRTESGQMVLCQCGFGKEEGDMVQCSYCSTWQHLHCYGYTGDGDPRLPDQHVCYWCLLGDTDLENYKKLQKLSLQRRAMFHVAKSGLRTRTDLSKAMDVGQDEAGELHVMIKKSKFVTGAEKSHKPGYRATGKALFVPSQDDATMRKLLETYFDPMTHVGHRYGARTVSEHIESEIQTNIRLIKALATDLPQPATPHRSKLKPLAASDTGSPSSAPPTPLPSAFDMRTSQELMATSETLQQTPTLRTRRKSKRALEAEEAEIEASDRKRFATPSRRQFTSLRSTTMIDANDKSSPYLQQ